MTHEKYPYRSRNPDVSAGGRQPRLIFEEGRYLHTSTVIAIHGVTPQQIRFETMNSHYCLLAPSSPVAADVPVTVVEQAA